MTGTRTVSVPVANSLLDSEQSLEVYSWNGIFVREGLKKFI